MNRDIKPKCEIQALSFPASNLLHVPLYSPGQPDNTLLGVASGCTEIYDRKTDIPSRTRRLVEKGAMNMSNV